MSYGSFFDPTNPLSQPTLGFLGVTDEYLADLAATEFAMICPKDQDGASGADGAFAAGSPTVLTSASAAFATNGVQVGDVVVILDSKKDSVRVRGVYIATVVADFAITLRSRGPRVGFGAPPGNPSGETGLNFRVPTAMPQIAVTAAKYCRRYRLATPASILGPNDFVPVVALDTLVDLYTLASRQAQDDGRRDSLAAKAKVFKADRDEEIRILDATYNVEPDVRPLSVGKLRFPSGVCRPWGVGSPNCYGGPYGTGDLFDG